MLEANFISGYETVTVQGLTQWDKGQKLKITGLATLPATYQVHFANTKVTEALVMMGSATGGVGTVDIPNSLLEDGLDIRAWIYVTDAEGSETIKTILMPVAERTKPADFITEPNPTEQSMLETALNTVNTTMGMLGDPNGIATLDNLGKVNTSQLPSYVDDVIEGYYSGGKFYKESAHTTLITGETGKVYLDISVSPADSYRYGGSAYAKINNVGDSAANTVTFSEASTLVNIASGETHATMFGKIKKLFTDMIAVKNKVSTIGTIINATYLTPSHTMGGEATSYLGYIDLDAGTYIVEGVGYIATGQDRTASLSTDAAAVDPSHEVSFNIPSGGGAVSYTGIISVTATTRWYFVVYLKTESVGEGQYLSATKLA